jgi:hypothetical protein
MMMMHTWPNKLRGSEDDENQKSAHDEIQHTTPSTAATQKHGKRQTKPVSKMTHPLAAQWGTVAEVAA